MKISQLFLAVGLLAMLPAMGMMVVRDQHGFTVRDGSISRRVNAWDMDKTSAKLAKMDKSVYEGFIKAGGKLRASRMSDGSYYLHDKSGLKGGGLLTAVIGGAITCASGLVATTCTTALVALTAGPLAAGPVCAAGLGTTYSATVYVSGVGLALPTP